MAFVTDSHPVLPEITEENASVVMLQNTSQPSRNAGSLPTSFRARDLILFSLLLAVTVGAVTRLQFGGLAVLAYWVIALITFHMPRTIVMLWLRKHVQGMSTPYHWAIHVAGHGWGLLVAFFLWWPGVVAVMGSLLTAMKLLQCIAPIWLNSPVERAMLITGILLISAYAACLPMKMFQRVLLVVAIPYLMIFALLGVLGIYWLARGRAEGFSLLNLAQWQFSDKNIAAYGLALATLLSLAVPNFLAGELKQTGTEERCAAISRFLWGGGLLSVVFLMAGTFGIMVIVPAAKAGGALAPVVAAQIVFGPYAVRPTALLLFVCQPLVSAVAILLYSRLLVVLAQEGHIPAVVGRTNRAGVPVLSIILHTLVTLLLALAIYIAVPLLFGNILAVVKATMKLSDEIYVYLYYIFQAGTSFLLALSVSLLFIAVIGLLLCPGRGPMQGEPPYKRWFTLFAASLGLLSACFAMWMSISHSWLPASLPGSVWLAASVGASIVLATIGWIIGTQLHVQLLQKCRRALTERELHLQRQLCDLKYHQQQLQIELSHFYNEQTVAELTDTITGLPNHRAVMHKIDDLLKIYAHSNTTCAFFLIDLDHFKQINNTWGHHMGDAILCEVAQRLHASLREDDFLGRYGGEEFVVMLTEVDINNALRIASRLLHSIADRPYFQDDAAISVTASIGLTVLPLQKATREDLIEATNRAVLRAKENGRNRVSTGDGLYNLPNKTGLIIHPLTKSVVETLSSMPVHHKTAYNQPLEVRQIVKLAESAASALLQQGKERELVYLATLLSNANLIGIPQIEQGQARVPTVMDMFMQNKRNMIIEAERSLSGSGVTGSIITKDALEI